MGVELTRCFEVSVLKKAVIGASIFNLQQLEVLFLNASFGGSTKLFKFLMTPLLLIHSLFCALKYCHYLYILIAAHNKWSTLRRNSLISKEVPLQKRFSLLLKLWVYKYSHKQPYYKKVIHSQIIGQELRNNRKSKSFKPLCRTLYSKSQTLKLVQFKHRFSWLKSTNHSQII